MDKVGKTFKSLSQQPHLAEERRVLLPQQEDPMAQGGRREVLVKINGQDDNADDVALFCSANSSFHHDSSLLRTKTKSRLMDPPEQSNMKGLTMKRGGENDEDDPFFDADLPQVYKKVNFTDSSVVQLVSLVLILAALALSLGFPKFMGKKLFQLDMWKWESMVLVLISGHLVSGWAIRIVVFFIEHNFLLRKRVLYFFYGVRNSVQKCIWLGFVLISWHFLFDKRVERLSEGEVILPFLARIWVCLLVGTLMWLLKTVVVKVLASSFHVSKFFDRIQESLFNQYVIETLSSPMKGKVLGSERFYGDMSKKVGGGVTIDHLHRLNQKNVSAWNMKRLMKIVRKGLLSTLDDRVQDSTQITSENKARAAAKKMFVNVAKQGSKCIYLEDLMRFLREDEAAKMMCLLQGASEGKGISKRALKNWVVNTFKERMALSLSLNDTKSAVNKLHHLLNIVVAILILAIWLLIFKVAGLHFLLFLGSQFLVVYFVLGKTFMTTLEAFMFLFVMHPFDVGDRCEVDGVQMVVEEMNILSTVFLRYDNQKIIYPNNVLATKPISNYYRSPDMGDAVDFCIHIATPTEKIAMMKEKITSSVESRSDHWYPAPMIVVKDVEDMNKLKMSVWVLHRMNHQDMVERWARRARLVEEMIKIFRELEIEYRMLPLDVNVRSMPALPPTWNTCLSAGDNACVNACVTCVNLSTDQK